MTAKDAELVRARVEINHRFLEKVRERAEKALQGGAPDAAFYARAAEQLGAQTVLLFQEPSYTCVGVYRGAEAGVKPGVLVGLVFEEKNADTGVGQVRLLPTSEEA